MIVKMIQADGSNRLYDRVAKAHIRQMSVGLVFDDKTKLSMPIEGNVFVMNDDGVTIDKLIYQK